jgi:hypothetical protein
VEESGGFVFQQFSVEMAANGNAGTQLSNAVSSIKIWSLPLTDLEVQLLGKQIYSTGTTAVESFGYQWATARVRGLSGKDPIRKFVCNGPI